MMIDDATNMSNKTTDVTPINPRNSISFFSTNATQTIVVAIVANNLTARKQNLMKMVADSNGRRESALNVKKGIAMDAADETWGTDSFVTNAANQMLVIGASVQEEEGVGVVVDGDEGQGGAGGGEGERAGEAVEGGAAGACGGAGGAVEEASGAEEEGGDGGVGEFL